MTTLARNTILAGDAATELRKLPAGSIDCVITSPPYYQLRDYGVRGQLGLERTVEDWVEALRVVTREVARLLKPAGSLWLNVGDSFSRHPRFGAPVKGHLLAPERLLLALARDGWIVRNKLIWAKTNPLPTSVADRLNTTYEPVYFLVRSRRYYFDLDAIREPHRPAPARPARAAYMVKAARGPLAASHGGLARARPAGEPGHWLGKNPGDVWRIATASYRGAHFATFPPALVERPLLATCPERLCTACGRPWRRLVRVERPREGRAMPVPGDRRVLRYVASYRVACTVGPLEPGCPCGGPTQPGVVLDPFFGTGTVGLVAARHGRDWLGVELNAFYRKLAWKRLGEVQTAAERQAA